MNEEKLIYRLFILRSDFQHISICETEDFDQIKSTWRKLTDSWKDSVKNQVPFELESPEITSFDPGLIREIKIIAIPEEISKKTNTNNPYFEKMKQEGLLDTMKFTGELQDGGYK